MRRWRIFSRRAALSASAVALLSLFLFGLTSLYFEHGAVRGLGVVSKRNDATTGEVVVARRANASAGGSPNATRAASAARRPRPHPHAGARYPDGSRGYVADPASLRRRLSRNCSAASRRPDEDPSKSRRRRGECLPSMTTEEFRKVCETPPGQGFEKKAWRLLTEKIRVGGPDPAPRRSAGGGDGSNATATPAGNATGGIATADGRRKDGDGGATSGTTDEPTALEGGGRWSLPFWRDVVTRLQRGEGEVGRSDDDDDDDPPGPRILCMVYTHPGRRPVLIAGAETWGKRCDGFLAFSTETNPDLGLVDLPHLGPESYHNMWQKTRSIWAYAHDNYLEEFDYFHLGGDDIHVIVENFRNYLRSLGGGGGYPLYLGHWIPRGFGYYCGGGPGYTLNREALKRLVRDAFPGCLDQAQASSEDRFVADCFRKIGVLGNLTLDAKKEARYHGMDPNYIYTFSNKSKGFFQRVDKFWQRFSAGPKHGMESASSQSVAFHQFRNRVFMFRQHAILYNVCPNGTVLGDAVREVRERRSNKNERR